MRTGVLYLSSLIIHVLPETRCFAFKRFLLRMSGAEIGKNVRICSSAKFFGNKNLVVGDNSWIGHDTLISCSADIIIGRNVNIAPRCYIGTGTHIISPDGASVAGEGRSYPITIEDGAWICAMSVILPGSHIGRNAIVAAGAVVKGEVQSRELVGGVPAKHIDSL
jgi:acetyltransferase-like isoleucine patch superfamily enzyme